MPPGGISDLLRYACNFCRKGGQGRTGEPRVLCSEAHLAMGAVTVDSEPEMLAAYADAMLAAVGQPICGRDDEGTRPAGLSLPRVTARNHVSWLAGFGRARQGEDPCTGRGSYGRDRPHQAPL